MAYTTITGNVGKEPEVKYSQSGKAWMPLSVAWSERVKNKAGEWEDGPTVWVSVRVFGKQAENAAQTLHKGTMVTCTGQLKPETWHSDQGEQTVFNMTADVVAPALFNQTAQVNKAASNESMQAAQNNLHNAGFTPQNNTGNTWGSPAPTGQDSQPPF